MKKIQLGGGLPSLKVHVEFLRLLVVCLGMPNSSGLSSYKFSCCSGLANLDKDCPATGLLQLTLSSVIVWALGLYPVDETSSSSPGVCCTFLLELLFKTFNLSDVEKNKIKLGRKKFCMCSQYDALSQIASLVVNKSSFKTHISMPEV